MYIRIIAMKLAIYRNQPKEGRRTEDDGDRNKAVVISWCNGEAGKIIVA